MNRAVIYTRVSTVEQADSGHSLETQLDKCQRYAEAQGYEVVATFTDAGLSGRRADNRPGLQDMLARKDYDLVIVSSLSRMGRNVIDLLSTVEKLRKRNVSIAFLDINIDTSTPMGNVLLTIMSAMAQMESELTAIRTKEISDFRKREMKSYCGNPPLGYRNSGGELREIPGEINTVQSIFRMWHKEQRGYNEIAGILNRRGLRGKNGGRFAAATIKQILNNQIYNERIDLEKL